jgi:hypothetical protein
VNIQILKKIVKFVIDSSNQDYVAFKVMAYDVQDIMKNAVNGSDSVEKINQNITDRTNLLMGPFSPSKRPKSRVKKMSIATD